MVYMAGTTGLAGALLDLASLHDTRWPQTIETHTERGGRECVRKRERERFSYYRPVASRQILSTTLNLSIAPISLMKAEPIVTQHSITWTQYVAQLHSTPELSSQGYSRYMALLKAVFPHLQYFSRFSLGLAHTIFS